MHVVRLTLGKRKAVGGICAIVKSNLVQSHSAFALALS